MAEPFTFIEAVNTLANASSLATGDIVADTHAARDEAVTARDGAVEASNSALTAKNLAKDWANKGHNNPVTTGEFSAYHWSVEAQNTIGDPIINDSIISSNYTWSSSKLSDMSNSKANLVHAHNGVYEPVVIKNSAFNKNFATATGDNGVSTNVARADHVHSGYEPKRTTSGTAYNKNFGTTSGTVAQGDHNHSTVYEPKRTTAGTAYNKNFVANTATPLSDEIPRGNHTHKASGVSYDNTGNKVITSTTVQGAMVQLDSVAGALTQAEKTKLIAGMTDASYLVDVLTVGTPVLITAGMTVGSSSKNALYSNGVVVNYPSAPSKLIEGQFDVSVTIEVLANKAYYITPTKNGVVIDSKFRAEVGSADKATAGAFAVSLSGWLSGLANLDNIGVAIVNMTDATDITLYSMTVSWAGQPEGALVASGITVQHNDTTARDATQAHPTTSIYDSGSTETLDVTLLKKADKVVTPVENNLLAMDSFGNLKDSGISISDSDAHMDKIAVPTLDNIIVMDSQGQSKDGGVTISTLATKNGAIGEVFNVANATLSTHAVNKGQMDGLAATYTTSSTFNTHVGTANPHGTSYTDVGAAPVVHTHGQNDITGLADTLATKYTKLVAPVTDNAVTFGSDGQLKDSGYQALNPDIFETKVNSSTVSKNGINASFIANGHTAEPKEYIETNTPYTMIDPSTDSLIVNGNVVEVVGEELVTNGNFSYGTTGWISGSGGILTESSGQLSVTGASGDAAFNAYQIIATEIGKAYSFKYSASSTDGTVSVRVGSSAGANENYSSVVEGVVEGTFIATLTTTYLTFYGIGDGTKAVFDNISVKEIKPIELPLAPFDPVSTDEVLDDSVNGLNCQMAHNKGDIVVTGAERVVNGRFDIALGAEWTASDSASLAIVSSTLELTNGGSLFGDAYQIIYTEIGKEYALSLDMKAGTNSARVFIKETSISGTTIDSYTETSTSFARTNIVFIATTTSTVIMLSSGSSTLSATSYYDNISVTLKDDVYQASVDTADMYDYLYEASTLPITITQNETVIKNTGGTGTGTIGNYYLRIGASVTLDSTLASLADTSNWLNLGTSSTMSLQNPYFKVLPRVSRQDVVVHRVNKSTLAYSKHSFKGTHLFEDTADSIEIMDYYYGSPDDKGLWSDATYWYLPLDCFERFNAGAYHPWENELGTRSVYNSATYEKWYVSPSESADKFVLFTQGVYTGVSGTLNGYDPVGGYIGTSRGGRPNSEFYDKVYINQSRDLRLKAYEEDDTTLLRNKASENESGRLDGVEGVVLTKYETQTTTGTVVTLEVADIAEYPNGTVLQIYDVTNSAVIGRRTVISSAGVTLTLDATIVKTTLNDVYMVGGAKSHHSFRSEYTMTDLIGDPANYPSSLKSRLASGKGVLINPLLVGQDGTDYLTTYNTILSKKMVDFSLRLHTDDSGVAWTSSGISNEDYVANFVSITYSPARVTLQNYQAKTNSTKSLPVGTTVATLDKVYVSNSHSIYKGGTAVASGTGKIPTGNGSNGFESGYLLNNLEPNSYKMYNATDILATYSANISSDGTAWIRINTSTSGVSTTEIKKNDRIIIVTNSGKCEFIATADSYQEDVNQDKVNGKIMYSTLSAGLIADGVMTYFGYDDTTPSHQIITLDNSDSIASKRFYTLEVDSNNHKQLVQYTTEVAYNSLTTSYDGDNELFDQLTDGTITDDNANVCITSRTAKKLNSFKGE